MNRENLKVYGTALAVGLAFYAFVALAFVIGG